jgi:truncated hemoglobin YjbI
VSTEPSLFEQLGGEPVLRRIVDRFVDRVFDDVMIGFFFRNASRERIKDKEYEFAARHLGADVAYTGKPIAEAHASHGIMGGQFMRRLQILEETLNELEVPEAVRRHWLAHNEKLRPLVTRDAAGHCDDGAKPDAL